MKGYRTYITAGVLFITAVTTMLFRFGVIGAELTSEQITSIEDFLVAFMTMVTPLIAYFRSKANK